MADGARSIHECAEEGEVAGVGDALARGTPVDAKDPVSHNTALMAAVASAKADVDLVSFLIQKGANVNAVRPGEYGGTENVLSIAIHGGNYDKIEALLNAGADVRYQRPHGYNALIDVMHIPTRDHDPQLVPIIELLLRHGADANGVSKWGESALRVAANAGRFDAVGVLLEAGADAATLQWTALMHAVALGSLEDVRREINGGADLSARDFWSRTPWLLSLQVGEVAKAELLLAAGANRLDRGRCGKVPLMYPIVNGHTQMLQWLLGQGFNPNDADDHGQTPLMEAAVEGATQSARILIDAGADIHRKRHRQAIVGIASNLEIVRLLVERGADLNDISDEMRAALTKQSLDEKIRVTREEYLAGRHRRFGNSNPEKMDFAFWKAMVASGAIAYAAQKQVDDTGSSQPAVWSFRRFGKSINELPDGRIIEIAGEHEDHYDPDFCIYNDVIVHHGDGTFDIYGYPQSCFEPTDFHSATLVGNCIYIIGSLGYPAQRRHGQTPVYRLDTETLEIERLETCGQNPGWISEHKATYSGDGRIQIRGGKVCGMEDGKETYLDNSNQYVLDLGSLGWTKIA